MHDHTVRNLAELCAFHPLFPRAKDTYETRENTRVCMSLKLNDLFGGEGGIRTHVPVTRQHAFEARPLRPLRYLSVR